jgi:hypothetical protein
VSGTSSPTTRCVAWTVVLSLACGAPALPRRKTEEPTIRQAASEAETAPGGRGASETADQKASPTRNDLEDGSPKKKSGEGSLLKPFLLGAGVGGLAAGGLLVARGPGSGKAPVAGTITTSTRTPLMSATVVQFDVQGAHDLDGDALTYSWDFGDGTKGDGRPITHRFDVPGAATVQVVLTVSDGTHAVATEPMTITITSLTGMWAGASARGRLTLDLRQVGWEVGGTVQTDWASGRIASGSVGATREVRLLVPLPWPPAWSWSQSEGFDLSIVGTVDESCNLLPVSTTYHGDVVLTRQR